MLKAIIVDDDRNVLNGLRTLIRWKELGYEMVGTASSGIEGLDLARKYHPDVIISDIVMPEMDGTDFLKVTKMELNDVSFIFLSAYESFPAAQTAIEFHVQSYILKPINREKLGIIEEELRKIHSQREISEFYGTLLFNHADELREALKKTNRAYFEHLFSQLLEDAVKLKEDTGLIRRTCMYLLFLMKEVWGENFSVLADLDFHSFGTRTDMIINTANACFDYIDRKDPAHNEEQLPLVAWIRETISDNLNDPDLGTTMIAQRLNYSASYISRIFTRSTGITPVEYISLRRMEAAAKLLTESSINIMEISERVGYRNSNYFSKVFRKTFGCQPTEYRMNNARRNSR